MKKVLSVLVLVMAALVVNAQATSTTPKTKSSDHKMSHVKATKTTIKVADLQKAITDNIAKDYAGYTIKSATSVTANSTVTYHVVIVKGTMTETLVYDKDGNFVKKMTPKAGMK
jgi:uncharacterized protein YxeA